ncbi:MAG: Ig-like domain-containing protein, partial [Armatimonadota bacterium]
MATLRRSPIFRMLLATAMGSLALTTLLPGLALGLPLVAITRPTQGATVTGVIWIDVAFRSDSNRPITRLEVYIDDQLAREVDLATPILEGRQSFNWDFSYAAATTHKIAARAIDSAAAAAAATITVQVANASVAGPDRIPPVVRIYYPAQGAKLHGQVEVKAEASDNVGVELVYFYIDGRLHKMMMNAPPYVDSWDTTREADGNHVVEAVAVDAQENEARSAQVTVIVENANMTLQNAGGMKVQGTSPLPTIGAPVPFVPTTVQVGAQPQWNGVVPPIEPTPAPTINPVAPAPTATLPTEALKPIGQVFQNTPVTPTPIPATTGSPTTIVRDVDPLLNAIAPKVAVVVPRAQAAGPVPTAPPTIAPLLPLGDPQLLITARTEGALVPVGPTSTSPIASATLPRPGTQAVLPTASAGSHSSPKAVAPTLT